MKLIDIAIFAIPVDAGVLESILAAENIPFSLNFQNSIVTLVGSGAVLSINEEDRDKVVKIIKDAGFGKYLI